MSASKVITAAKAKEISADSRPTPDDINLEVRKDIVRKALQGIVGQPIAAKNKLEKQRLKNVEFRKNKTRKKIANKSQRRNRG